MINITDKSKCSGCAACYSICPKHAIMMRGDDLGFEFPTVDTEKCIGCGLCDKVCMYNAPFDLNKTIEAYGVRHKDKNEVLRSRSGAIFIALSDYVLNQGGSIYGAAFDSNQCVKHMRGTTCTERDKFRGSKYVQSSINDTFLLVKNDLMAGKSVLFSGTPCQIYGLKKFINPKLTSKLYTVDIICHGVPSPAFYKDYLRYIASRNKSEIISVNFRNKDLYGWAVHYESFNLRKNGKEKTETDTFYTLFYYNGYLYRDSCVTCPFSTKDRVGDVTIGDFWGWEKTTNQINKDNIGLSIVLINTQKGIDLFNQCKGEIIYFPAKWQEYTQPNLIHPSKPNENSNQFKQDYIEKGIEYVQEKYGPKGLSRLRYRIRRLKALLKHCIEIQ